jgi:hypothetical protein
VTALLRPRLLVLEVHPGGAGLHEELDELHDRAQASMSGVAVGDDGGQIVDLRPWILPGEDGGCALFVLTAVVMELCPYELIACALGCFANETGSINASVHVIKPLCTPLARG